LKIYSFLIGWASYIVEKEMKRVIDMSEKHIKVSETHLLKKKFNAD
jgi:hypothetical protein